MYSIERFLLHIDLFGVKKTRNSFSLILNPVAIVSALGLGLALGLDRLSDYF